MTRISLIVALDEGGLIGRDGQLPWRLPEDLKHFRRLTLGKTIVMGRKTFESLGKPLDQRDNRVLSRDPAFRAPGCRVFLDLDAALDTPVSDEVMIIGGAQLYAQALPQVQRLYLTRVQARLDGDTRFPPFEAAAFRELERTDYPADERHAWPYSFVTLERK